MPKSRRTFDWDPTMADWVAEFLLKRGRLNLPSAPKVSLGKSPEPAAWYVKYDDPTVVSALGITATNGRRDGFKPRPELVILSRAGYNVVGKLETGGIEVFDGGKRASLYDPLYYELPN